MWKTNKWVPEWVIRPAIAHLHGPSILAGVQEQNIWTESLLPHPPPPTPATSWRATGGGKPKLSGSTLSHPELQPHLGKSFSYISVAPLRDRGNPPFPQSTLKVCLMASAGTLVIRLCDPLLRSQLQLCRPSLSWTENTSASGAVQVLSVILKHFLCRHSGLFGFLVCLIHSPVHTCFYHLE